MAVNGILLGQIGNYADKILSNIEPAYTDKIVRTVTTTLIDTAVEASTISVLNGNGGWYFYDGSFGQLYGGPDALYPTISFTSSDVGTIDKLWALGNDKCFYIITKKANSTLKYTWKVYYGDNNTPSLTSIYTMQGNPQVYNSSYGWCLSEPSEEDGSTALVMTFQKIGFLFINNSLVNSFSLDSYKRPFCLADLNANSILYCLVDTSLENSFLITPKEYYLDNTVSTATFNTVTVTATSTDSNVCILPYDNDTRWYIAIGKDVYFATYAEGSFSIETSPRYSFEKTIVSLYEFSGSYYVVFTDNTAAYLQNNVTAYFTIESGFTNCMNNYCTSSNNIYALSNFNTAYIYMPPFREVLSNAGFCLKTELEKM